MRNEIAWPARAHGLARLRTGSARLGVTAAGAAKRRDLRERPYLQRQLGPAFGAGVKVIEHGQLVDEATARLMADKGIWWCLQPLLDDADWTPLSGGRRVKQLAVAHGTDIAYALAKKHKIRTAWGTDLIFSPELAARQGEMLAKLVRWYTPGEVLKMATGDNGQLLALSGLRSPYPGKLGVVEEGALADLLLVDGDPVDNILLIEDPERNFLAIRKDGVLLKHVVPPRG